MERVAIAEGKLALDRPQARICQVLTDLAHLGIPALLRARPLAVQHPVVASGQRPARIHHPLTVARQRSALPSACDGTHLHSSLTAPRIHDTIRTGRGAPAQAGSSRARSRPRATATFELRFLCDAVVPAVDGGTQVESTDLQHKLGIVGQPALERIATEAHERL